MAANPGGGQPCRIRTRPQFRMMVVEQLRQGRKVEELAARVGGVCLTTRCESPLVVGFEVTRGSTT